MKKTLYALGISCIVAMTMLSGCGSDDYPALSTQQEDAVGEYAARLLLKYDANNRSRLVDRAQVEEKQAKDLERKQKIEEAKKKQEQEKGDKKNEQTSSEQEQTPVNNMTLEEVLGLPAGVMLNLQGYSFLDTYPGEDTEDFFSMDATPGKKLLVVQFELANNSGEAQQIDFLTDSITARVSIGDSSSNALPTMLLDDLLTYRGTLDSQSFTTGVVVFQVDENLSQGQDSIQLTLKKESNKYTIQVQ